jgi:regulator of protease activity HflC (stomatin/prohibitin superfamily)
MSNDKDQFMRQAEEMRKKAKAYGGLMVMAVIGVFLFILAANSFYTVDAGERGIVLRFGALDKAVGEGLHFKIPVADEIKMINVRITKSVTEIQSSSKDLQVIRSEIALNYRVDEARVAELYTDVGMSWESTIVDPAVKESFKAITAGFTAEELITKRADVSEAISANLSEKLNQRGLMVQTVSITDFSFSSQFNAAIEQKQIAEQNALKARRDLDRIRLEGEQKVVNAKAEAESLRLQKQQVTAQLLKLREIEVQAAAVRKWDGKLPNVTGGTIPFINVN